MTVPALYRLRFSGESTDKCLFLFLIGDPLANIFGSDRRGDVDVREKSRIGESSCSKSGLRGYCILRNIPPLLRCRTIRSPALTGLGLSSPKYASSL
mmetsp:Transcript_43432/g.49974  ORF Transcript_43432/g.49974 Transcript_43432/m.49974 type:complete len:97 (+) Transcript_43432:1185-1475(+)